MSQSILNKALFPEPETVVIVERNIEHVLALAETAGLTYNEAELKEMFIVATEDTDYEKLSDGLLSASQISYGNLGMVDSIVSKFKVVTKFINSLTDFASWSTDEIKDVETLLAQTKGDTDGEDVKLGGGARFLQLYPTKSEDVETVLKELREYIEKVLPSDSLYKAVDRFIDASVDMLALYSKNLTKEARENSEFSSGTQIQAEIMEVYKSIYFDTIEDLKKAFLANKEIDDKRYGKNMTCFTSKVLPANMTVAIPSLREDAAFVYKPLKSELTSLAKSGKWLDMRSIKTNGNFSENLPPLKRDQIDGVLKEVGKLTKVLDQAKEIGKNHIAVEKAMEKALVKAEAVYDEKGIPAIEKAAAKLVLRACRSDAMMMLKAITDLSNLSVETIQSSLKLCRYSIKNYK